MTPRSIGILTLILAMAVESFAQMGLKIGAGGGPGILSSPYRERALRWPVTASARTWMAGGVSAYAVEIFLYTLALHLLDVSTAFPMGSLCFVGVALLSKVFLGEAVGPVRWLGVCCILAGTVFLGL